MVYWLISVPCENDKKDLLYTKVSKVLKSNKIEHNAFEVPQLKVGTLDTLMSISDDIQRMDTSIENITMKALKSLKDVSEIEEDKFRPEINVEERKKDIKSYLTNFEWDDSKYMQSKDLKSTTEKIFKTCSRTDDDLKIKVAEYQTLSVNISQIERKEQGSLMIRPLDGIVQEEHVYDSEYFTTLFTVIPKHNYQEWLSKYEDLVPSTSEGDPPAAVPASSTKIFEDGDLGLFNVVVLKIKAQDFKTECEKKKFKIREFKYDEERNKLSAIETQKLKEKKDDMRNELLGWCVNGFSESFINWIHLKCIKTFVESVLRYGVPPRFLTFLVKANGNERKIHKIFKDEFKELEEDDIFDDVDSSQGFAGNDFYPYVLIPINTSDPLLQLN